MEGWIFQTGLHEVGPWGLLLGFAAFIVLGIVRGWLVPKTQHDAAVNSALARATAAEAANERLSERAAKLTESNFLLAQASANNTAVGDTVTKLIHAIQDARVSAGGSE